MATISIQAFKGWEKFAAATDPKRFRSAMKQKLGAATEQSCKDVKNEIAKRIRGKEYTENSPLTILLKMSSLPLVGGNTGIGKEMGGSSDVGGTMLNSLKYTSMVFEGYIGVTRSRKNVNIPLVLHEGATLQITAARRRWLAMVIKSAKKKQGMSYSTEGGAYSYRGGEATSLSKGHKASNSGTVIHIPARPFIKQAMQDRALQQRIIDRWCRAAADAVTVK